MKRIVFFLLVILSFADVKAQFPSTDSLRDYNILWITNNAARAFTNYRLHTLLAGIIDWIDTARTGGGGSIGIDSIAALNDSTLRYRINGTFRTFTFKGVYDARRKVDTVYKNNDTTIAFKINGDERTIIIPGRVNFVDSIYRKAGQDSIFYRRQNIEYAIKDSSGGAGNTNLGSAFRWLNPGTQEIKTVADSWGIKWDSTSTANSLTAKPDTGATGLATQYDLTQIPAEGIQPTLVAGDTANRRINFKDLADTGTTHSFFTQTIVPGNYNTSYAYGPQGLWHQGFSFYPGVNPGSGRPNSVFSPVSYNMNPGGSSRLLSTEAALGLFYEGHFEMGGAQPYFEMYPQIIQTDGFAYRPFFSVFRKNAREHTYTRKITTENVLWLSPTGADDTALHSITSSGQAWGSIGEYTLSATNRRAPTNTFMFSTSANGPTIGGTGSSENKLTVSVPLSVNGSITNANTYGGNVLLGQTALTSHLRFLPANQAISTRAGIFNQVTATEVTYIGIGINSSFLFGNGSTANVGGSTFYTTNNSVPPIQFATKAAGSTTDIVAGVFASTGNFAVGGGAVVTPVSEVTIYERAFSGTNTAPTMMSLVTETSGTPAAGLGAKFDWRVENAANLNAIIAEDWTEINVNTNTAETGSRVWSTKIAGTMAERLRITSTGALRLNNAFSFPTTDGTSGQVLQTNGSGVVTWQTVSGGGGGITSINSETGPAITIAGGTGISINTTTNTITASLNSSYITSGTYTPTLTGIANIEATSVYGNFYYTRIGNLVTVTGVILVNPTAANTSTQLDISLPIASALTNFYQLTGQAGGAGGSSGAESSTGGHIVGNTTDDRATFIFYNLGFTGAADYTIRFTYEVL